MAFAFAPSAFSVDAFDASEGATLLALNAGSLNYRYVVAIEGYSKLLTTASTTQAVTAWDGTDWADALGGTFVEVDNRGSADPWEPFQGGGTCTLRVVPDAADTFGIDTHRKLSGAETYLTATADRNDTTINVLSTNGFAASGEAFIGTECFAYSGVTATTFTGVTRGKYSPFQTSTGAAWAGHHRVGLASNRVKLSPIVSQQPRTWIGKWVAVYIHRVASSTAIDAEGDAHLVYAGKIVEVVDDASGATVVHLKHVLDTLGETTIGRDQFTAEVAEGLFLRAGQNLRMRDWTSFPATSKTSNPLAVVASGATGTNQINSGYHTLSSLAIVISAWLAGELHDGRIYGTYTMSSPVTSPSGLRTKIYYRIPNGASTQVKFELEMPALLAMFLGYTDYSPDLLEQVERVTIAPTSSNISNTDYRREGSTVPLRTIVAHREANIGGQSLQIGLKNEVGTFVDQFDILPPGSKPIDDENLEWGIFSFNDSGYIVAAYDNQTLRQARQLFGFIPGASTDKNPLADQALVIGIDQTAPIVIKQIVAVNTTFAAFLKGLFYGSGTLNFNHPTLDTLPHGFGAGIPGSLLGSEFEDSIDALPGAAASLFVFIEKTMRISDAISSDLILRWAFPRWRQGIVSFSSWTIPSPDDAIAALTEHTKARPSGTKSDERATTSLSEEWQRDTITIMYNRKKVANEEYLSYLTFEDATAVDDAGGEGKPITIKARNTYAEAVASGTGIEQIAPDFLALAPLFTRPFRKQTLSIGPALYEQLAPGDIVTVSDSFARDPTTGIRGISERPAIVIRTRHNRGGAQLGNSAGIPAQGEVDVMLAPDQSRLAAYAPAARLDDTADTGGFSSGYNSSTLTLRCVTHENSLTSEDRDASRFSDGDAIIIIENDPAVSSAPLFWQRTVTGTPINDDIVIDSALTSPSYDAAKRYTVTYDHYAVQTAAQQRMCSQADDADGKIEDLDPPFQYGAGNAATAFTAYDPTIPVELVPDASYGDGKALDVGHEAALVQLGNNLIDYRTAHHGPVFGSSEFVSTTLGTFELMAYFPVFLTTEGMGSINRSISVAPFMKGTGAPGSIRISLCSAPPTQNSVDDLDRPTDFSAATFTTSGTTFETPSAQLLVERAKPINGIAWIWIEGTIGMTCHGLARFDQGPRA